MTASGDLLISGCGTNTGTQFTAGCSRWSRSGFEFTVEIWTNPQGREKIWSSVVPKACDEIYSILGQPTYWDTTFSSGNTLKLEPVAGVGNLSEMRSGNLFTVNDYSEEFVNWETFHIKFSVFPVAGYVG